MEISADQLLDLIHDAKNVGWQEGYKVGLAYPREKSPQALSEPLIKDTGSVSGRAVPRPSQGRSNED